MTSCVELLLAEHRETELQLAVLEEMISASVVPWTTVQAHYALLAADLYRHFVLEERALFALLSQYRSMMLMEVEHDDLLVLRQGFEQSLNASVSAGVAEPTLLPSFQAFQARLKAHILEEERGIFPLVESWLEPEEQAKALRVFNVVKIAFEQQPIPLFREKPALRIRETGLFQPPEKRLSYETLYEREHSMVQHLSLQMGMRQNLHWVGQHQCLILLTGEVELQTEAGTELLKPGLSVSIDSRLYFALNALSDAHLLVFKVWPHPHYTKTMERGSDFG